MAEGIYASVSVSFYRSAKPIRKALVLQTAIKEWFAHRIDFLDRHRFCHRTANAQKDCVLAAGFRRKPPATLVLPGRTEWAAETYWTTNVDDPNAAGTQRKLLLAGFANESQFLFPADDLSWIADDDYGKTGRPYGVLSPHSVKGPLLYPMNSAGSSVASSMQSTGWSVLCERSSQMDRRPR